MRAGDLDTAGPVWLYRPRQHKTDRFGHVRVVAVGPRARAVLAPWLARARAKGADALVFPTRRGTGYTDQTYARAVRRCADRVGLPGLVPSQGRHATAERVRRGAGDVAARDVLGHASLGATQRYGAKVNHQHAADVQRRLG